MTLSTMFQPRGKDYCPKQDEPSPFGPEVVNLVDNPWVVWKRGQEGYDERAEGSPTELRETLMLRLSHEHIAQVELQDIQEPPLTVNGGRHLSLAWVIYYNAATGFNFERCHRFGLEKMKKEQAKHDE